MGQSRSFIAHTIIPGKPPDFAKMSFGESDFVSLREVIDLVLTSDTNENGDVTCLSVRGYRASYDPQTNRVLIGGAANFKFSKDLLCRPKKDAHGWIINPV